MTPEEIENKRVERLKEINATRESLNIVLGQKSKLSLELTAIKQEIAAIYKRRVDKEAEIEALAEPIRAARHILSVKNTDAEILESEFWRAKG